MNSPNECGFEAGNLGRGVKRNGSIRSPIRASKVAGRLLVHAAWGISQSVSPISPELRAWASYKTENERTSQIISREVAGSCPLRTN